MSNFVLSKKTLVVALLGAAILGGTQPTFAAPAQICLPPALQATKAALGDEVALVQLYNEYFGDALAKKAVENEWSALTPAEKSNQKAHARDVVLSYASMFAEYANSKFEWHGNKAKVITPNGDSKVITQMTVYMSGYRCQMSDVCIKGRCLSNAVGDGTNG